MIPDAPSNPNSDQSQESFSSAKESRELITGVPNFPNATPGNTGPQYVEGEKVEKPIYNGNVMVKRSDGTRETDWVVESHEAGTDNYVVVSADGTEAKDVTSAQLEAWQPKFSAGESLVMPAGNPNEGKWIVVEQAADKKVRIVEDGTDLHNDRTRIKVISAAEASKYTVED